MADEYVRAPPMALISRRRHSPASERATLTTVVQNAEEAAELKKRRAFRKFSYRGIDLDKYVATHAHLRGMHRRGRPPARISKAVIGRDRHEMLTPRPPLAAS